MPRATGGRVAETRDNVRRDVEHFTGSPFDDGIVASRSGLIQAFPGTSGLSLPQLLTVRVAR